MNERSGLNGPDSTATYLMAFRTTTQDKPQKNHLEVVGAHEEVRDAGAHDPQNPFVKVGGRALRQRVVHLGGNQARQALDLR